MLMTIAQIFFWVLGIMFFVGVFGSALVVILTSIDDVKDLREKKESEPVQTASMMPPMNSSEWA